MTKDAIHISAEEHGRVRLFALDMRPEQIAFLRDEPGALAQLLQINTLDMAQVDVFYINDLEDLGLAGYLSEGCGIARSDLDLAMLNTLSGAMMAIRSRAFEAQACDLTLPPSITLVETFSEETTKWSARAMETPAAAKPQMPQPKKTTPRQARAEARRIGATLFGFVMALIALGLFSLLF
ncbi:hypothetical protein [Epibacterium ulvae]|uniref:hypothetical protein n=1 Tax=Epibacterium ulvae TaxID=1156985 RepID=UPI0024907145|nr:hypothetical protein [Epibacterium ulvae]